MNFICPFKENTKLSIVSLLGTLLIIILVFVISFFLEKTRINKENINHIYTVKEAVAKANQYIRNAAIMSDKEKKLLELEGRMLTRKRANISLSLLEKNLCLAEDKHTLTKINETRSTYRIYQNEVVNSILKNEPDLILEKKFEPYQKLQDQYDKELNTLLFSLSNNANLGHKIISILVLTLLVVCNAVSVILYIIYKNCKEIKEKNKLIGRVNV